jgi:hypothetical protein
MSQGPWFVRFAGRRSGPFDAERLRTLARRGALTRMHALSVDGRAWTPATSVRAVFNEDGSVVASGTASLEVEADEAPDDFAGIPDSGVIELPPSLPMRARLGSARVRPVVLCAMLLATVMLALPTSRDEAGAVAWWWHQGPISISVRGLAALAVLAGWVVAFLRPEPARAASVAGVAAVLSAASAASLAPWAPWASLIAPLVPIAAILVAFDAAGAASVRLMGKFALSAAGLFGLGAITFGVLRPSVWSIVSIALGAVGVGALVFAGVQAARAKAPSTDRVFWGGVVAATGAMGALFAAAFGGLAGDVPMHGAEAAAAACLVLAFATLSWAAVHETVETVHTLPRADVAGVDAPVAAVPAPTPAPMAWHGPDVPPPEA